MSKSEPGGKDLNLFQDIMKLDKNFTVKLKQPKKVSQLVRVYLYPHQASLLSPYY